jgi:hypothetical protein
LAVTHLICPDGQTIEKAKCIAECRMGERCIDLPGILAVSRSRQWYGKPSVTQLIQPTRQAYLLITTDQTINPDKSLSSMIGTNSHALMERNMPNGYICETRFEDDICSGQIDAYNSIEKTLIDYKFYGAYQLAKKLGHMPTYGPTGEYYVKGPSKGKEKWGDTWKPCEPDIDDVQKQGSYYKVLLEAHGLQVDRFKLQMFLRGGLDKVARSYGIIRFSNPIYVPLLPKVEIRAFMVEQHNYLMYALNNKCMPPICEDRWYNDMKCKEYCGVNVNCPYYQEKYLKA